MRTEQYPIFLRPRPAVVTGASWTETFTRANAALGTASDGVPWTYTDPWQIISNKGLCRFPGAAAGTGPSGTTMAYRANAVGATFTATLNLDCSGEGPAMAFRVVDTTNFHIAYLSNSGSFFIYRVVAGAFTLIGTSAGSQYTISGANISLVVTNNATTGDITATVNLGTTLSVPAEATNKAVAPVGLYVNSPAGFSSDFARFNNLAVS